MAVEKRDVMIRSFPTEAHKRAKLAAAARELGIGDYLARLVDLHTGLLKHARGDDARARQARDILAWSGLGEVRA